MLSAFTALRTLSASQAQAELTRDFVREANVLILDAQYDAKEYKSHMGWGHGCLDDVVALAIEANVKRLFLFHHDPDHDDAKIASMVEHAREKARAAGSALRIEAAREGERVALASSSDDRRGSSV